MAGERVDLAEAVVKLKAEGESQVQSAIRRTTQEVRGLESAAKTAGRGMASAFLPAEQTLANLRAQFAETRARLDALGGQARGATAARGMAAVSSARMMLGGAAIGAMGAGAAVGMGAGQRIFSGEERPIFPIGEFSELNTMMREVGEANLLAAQGLGWVTGKLYAIVTGPARWLGMMRQIEEKGPVLTPEEKRARAAANAAAARRSAEESANFSAMDRENDAERLRLRYFFDPIAGARAADEARIRPTGVTEEQFRRNVNLRDQYRKLEGFVTEATKFAEGLGMLGDKVKEAYGLAKKEGQRVSKEDRKALDDLNRADADVEESRQQEYRDSVRNQLRAARRQVEAARDAADQRITLAEPADVYRMIQEAIRPQALDEAVAALERIEELEQQLVESNDFNGQTLTQIHGELNRMNLGFR